MKIIAIGTDHRIQHDYRTKNGPLIGEQDGQRRFRAILAEIISGRGLTHIAEEANLRIPTFAQQLAATHGLTYGNIQPTYEEQAAAGICQRSDVLDWRCSEEQYTQDLPKKEPLMFAHAARLFVEAECGLLICGSFHLTRLATMFRGAGHEVEERDLRSARWWNDQLDS
jgi:hypothetical protein